MYKLGLEKAEQPEIKLTTLLGSWGTQGISKKDIYFSFIGHVKVFDYVDNNNQRENFTGMGISDHLTCLQRNLYSGQEATVRTEHGTMDWLLLISLLTILIPAFDLSTLAFCKMYTA